MAVKIENVKEETSDATLVNDKKTTRTIERAPHEQSWQEDTALGKQLRGLAEQGRSIVTQSVIEDGPWDWAKTGLGIADAPRT